MYFSFKEENGVFSAEMRLSTPKDKHHYFCWSCMSCDSPKTSDFALKRIVKASKKIDPEISSDLSDIGEWSYFFYNLNCTYRENNNLFIYDTNCSDIDDERWDIPEPPDTDPIFRLLYRYGIKGFYIQEPSFFTKKEQKKLSKKLTYKKPIFDTFSSLSNECYTLVKNKKIKRSH